jgi:hypothetical protein
MSFPLKSADADVVDISSWSDTVRTKAKTLSKQLETNYMELAKLLYYVCDKKAPSPPFEPIYKLWGYTSFENYAEEELGINEGKAKALRRLWFRLEVELVELPQEIRTSIAALGWSKVNQLIKVITPTNAQEWIQRAKEENYATLCVSIKAYQNSLADAAKTPVTTKSVSDSAYSEFIPNSVPLPPKQKLYHKYLYFNEEQFEIIELAMKKAAMLYGGGKSSTEAALLTNLLTEWLATTITGDGPDAKIKYFSKLEKQAGLKLVVVENETDRIVYGFETLEKLASKTEEEINAIYGQDDSNV